MVANDDLLTKLAEEKAKFDHLLSGRQDIEEQLKRKQARMLVDKEVVSDQDLKLAELKALIDEEQRLHDDQSAQLELARKLNKF